MRRRSFIPLLPAGFLCLALAGEAQTPLPEGSAKEVVQAACTQCHGLNRITDTGYSPSDWQEVMSMMMANGARVPHDQMRPIIDYLAKNFPEKPAPPAVIVP